MRVPRGRWIGAVAAAGLLLSACSSGSGTSATSTSTGPAGTTTYVLQPAHTYTPKAPPGGTDDYHCTLVDPHVTTDSMIVSSQFVPQDPVVNGKTYQELHHAILFLIPPNFAAEAHAVDHNGQGWTCFGETTLPGTDLNIPLSGNEQSATNTPWLTAWAPGHGLDTVPAGTGVPFPKGSLVVMQVHYNLLAGDYPVRSKLILHTVPASSSIKPLQLDLLPAPPDIPCPAGVTGPLCDRAASLADLGKRFGEGQVHFVNLIERVCGRDPNNPPVGDTTSCTWPVGVSEQVVRVTAHMHLLGRQMQIVLDPGTPKQQTLLDVTNYNFDDQRSYNLAHPVQISPGDKIQVTCTYDAKLRQELPELRKLPPRFVTWGDGSSDEMCLGILQSIQG